MAAPRLTTAERRLAEQYVSVLDFVSRCALAVDRGDWHYLWDKAASLARAADTLAGIAAEVAGRQARRSAPRGAAVRAAVAVYGRHYRACQLLHPLPQPQLETRRPGGGERR